MKMDSAVAPGSPVESESIENCRRAMNGLFLIFSKVFESNWKEDVKSTLTETSVHFWNDDSF